MQTKEKPNKESGRAQLALLIAVTLASGGAGVWTEVKASATSTRIVANSIAAFGFDAGGLAVGGSIDEMGDGTAWVSASIQSAWVGGSAITSDYSISVSLPSGQAGKKAGSGNGAATILGNNWATGNPVLLGLALSVSPTTEERSAFNNHDLRVYSDPFTGQTAAFRVTSLGNQAWGSTAGSISVTMDGLPAASLTGVSGQVRASSQHVVTRIK